MTARPEPARASRLRLWRGLAGCVLLAACGSSGSPSEGSPEASRLTELERLAFVPPGMAELAGPKPRAARALLVDRFEVTRAQWLLWLESDPEVAEEFVRENAEGPATWPAVWMNLEEARAFAQSRDMRLPTASEWFFIAMGPRGQDWPWSQYAAQAVSNTQEIGLGSPSPVGVFEQGRTAHGVYDLIGNVWEWVEGRLPAEESFSEEFTWKVGGAFNWPLRELHLSSEGFNAQEIHREQRSNSVGLRCVADAETFLRSHAAECLEADEARARLLRVGQGWGPSALPLLRRCLEGVSEVGSDAGTTAIELLLEGADS